jgi:hypothetical protein
MIPGLRWQEDRVPHHASAHLKITLDVFSVRLQDVGSHCC